MTRRSAWRQLWRTHRCAQAPGPSRASPPRSRCARGSPSCLEWPCALPPRSGCASSPGSGSGSGS
eukprot:scaffold35365_cov24-Phaeocystis_antarctica.AAC.1